MDRRLGLGICLLVVGLASLWTIEPRLHHEFPSMIDDWSAILRAPEQLREVLRLGNPEGQRYRPGFVMWNALQWHTLGAPKDFFGPLLWGVARWAVLVLGVTALAALLIGLPARRRDPRWLLLVGVPLVAVTAPSIAIDIARYGPQEPLLVGCMALGSALLVREIDGLLEGARTRALDVLAIAAGVAFWWFGVLQKETSICVLLLAPFLLPTLRAQRPRWDRLGRGRRLALGGVGAAILVPFVPMVGRTVELALAKHRVYEEAASSKSFSMRLSDQLSQAGGVLHSQVPTITFVAAVVLLAAVTFRFGPDWLSIGLLVVTLAFIVFAADAGVVASRYYIPAILLAAVVVGRSAVTLGALVTVAVGAALVVGSLVQVRDAHHWVWWWVDGERAREALVREAAARAAGGCEVDATGLNLELVAALPVLMPLADERPHGCTTGQRFLVVMDAGGPGTVTPPDAPAMVACAPERDPVWSSVDGEILRCTR